MLILCGPTTENMREHLLGFFQMIWVAYSIESHGLVQMIDDTGRSYAV